MRVKAAGPFSSKIYTDIPVPVAVLLADLGLITILPNPTSVEPDNKPKWGIYQREMGRAISVSKTDMCGTIYYDGPPADCPPEVVAAYEAAVARERADAVRIDSTLRAIAGNKH